MKIERITYPPPHKRRIYCIACFRQSNDVTMFEVPPFEEVFLHEDLHALFNLASGNRSLCSRCCDVLQCNGPTKLRKIVSEELVSSPIPSTLVVNAFLDVEVGITFASWCCGALNAGEVTPGLDAWCAILDRFPRDPALPTKAERDLGNGVYGVFATFAGGLWINNIVSRVRRKGYARTALGQICDIADTYGAAIYGKVEPNPGAGYSIGALLPDLLMFYAAFGFAPTSVGGATIVRRPPSPRAL